jgi:hypothetical protein
MKYFTDENKTCRPHTMADVQMIGLQEMLELVFLLLETQADTMLCVAARTAGGITD